MNYIMIIKTDGYATREEFNENDSLHQLQNAVGGYIERIPMEIKFGKHNLDFWCDEEGLVKGGKEVNLFVTALFGNPIVGDVAIAKSDEDGETIGLTEDDLKVLKQNLRGLVYKF